MEFTKEDLAKIAVQIQKTLRDADRVVFKWDTGDADVSNDKQVVRFLLEKAFAQTMLLLDAAKLNETLGDVRALNEEAKKEYAETDFYEDLYLVWTGKLERYIEPFLPDVTRKEADEQAMSAIEEICSGFASAAKVLGSRRRKRKAFDLQDEYDLQDLLEALLRVHFNDVRPEEPNPSVAGQSTRVDFFLKRERFIVEAKMARNNYKDAKIGDDLIKDVARYQARDDYDTLVCFIYDPGFLIKNPSGLAADVQSQQSRLATKVLYGPAR
jgi:hypothetical protein